VTHKTGGFYTVLTYAAGATPLRGSKTGQAAFSRIRLLSHLILDTDAPLQGEL